MATQFINGTTIHYEEKGDGPLLVLLHGFPLDWRMWAAQIDELSSRWHVIAPDFRGFGKSPDGGPFTVPSLADDIRAVARASSPCSESDTQDTGRMPVPLKYVLAGLSMGGYVAMNLA